MSVIAAETKTSFTEGRKAETMEKRNVCIFDCFDYVIIETEKTKPEIEAFCRTYCYQIENDCYTVKPETIGRLLYDTEINSNDPPESTEFYNLADYWEA